MNINIRKADKSDCERMMELVRELALYEKAPNEVTVDLNHFIESGFGSNPVWWAYVAEITNEDNSKLIVGFALYYVRYSTWKGQRMYLEDIIVTENMRGKGIGKKLFDQLIVVCKELQFKGITWQVLDWNEPAINFYKKFDGVQFDGAWVNCSL
ncbi:MAG: GNAT family N-acetyltransferase [Sphingobacteriales bacterium]|nr:GNAT family N-acetyltransferase [Sphingobacteriales bacterium]